MTITKPIYINPTTSTRGRTQYINDAKPYKKSELEKETLNDDTFSSTEVTGNWTNGLPTKGTLTISSTKVTGNWRNGLPTKGTLTITGNYIDKGKYETRTHKYEGEFKDGVPHGKGRLIINNEILLEGIFENGLPNGEGKITYKTQTILNGKITMNELVN